MLAWTRMILLVGLFTIGTAGCDSGLGLLLGLGGERGAVTDSGGLNDAIDGTQLRAFACYFDDGTLEEMEELACTDAGGQPHVVGAGCDPDGCVLDGTQPGVLGCSFDDGALEGMGEGACTGAGGQSHMMGMLCGSGGCAMGGMQQGVFACYFNDGSLEAMDEMGCTNAGGQPHMMGATCGPEGCELNGDEGCDGTEGCGSGLGLMTGNADGTLRQMAWPADGAMGGMHKGTTACCSDDAACEDMDPMDCMDAGGRPNGMGSSCESTDCDMSGDTTACCLGDDTCEDMDPMECMTAGGQPNGMGSTCASSDCADGGGHGGMGHGGDHGGGMGGGHGGMGHGGGMR